MTQGNDGTRTRLIPKLLAGLVPLLLVLIWAVLPRFANAMRDGSLRSEQNATHNQREVEDPNPVPRTLIVTGRVVDSNEQPVAGAKVYLDLDPEDLQSWQPTTVAARATTGADGKFQFTVERSLVAAARSRRLRFSRPLVAAFAEGYGPDWTDDLMVGDPGGIVLKLVADDVPITGRLLDLEGRPVSGVKVRVIQVDATPQGDLSRWLTEIRKAALGYQAFVHFTRSLSTGLSALIQPVTTDSDGRFRIAGSGRERLVSLLIEGPKIETQVLNVMTRGGPSSAIRFKRSDAEEHMKSSEIVIHAVGFDAVAAPTRAVEGFVKDAATGLPLQGVVIRAALGYRAGIHEYPLIHWPAMLVRVTTDVSGHFQLTGLPTGEAVELLAVPAEITPYLPASRVFANTPGVDPTKLDFALKRGVPVRGRVTDRSTQKPVAALVEYHPTVKNENVESPHDLGLFEGLPTHDDGSFSIVAFPGPGVVAAMALGDRFLNADLAGVEQASAAGPLLNVQGRTSPRQCHAFEAISPEKSAESCQCELALSPGPEPIVTILDSDGQPLSGAMVSGISPADVVREGWWQSREKAVFRVTGLTNHRIRRLLIHHEGRRLAG
jgi:protocatechuate 3,4-dioxygenase beta subunit